MRSAFGCGCRCSGVGGCAPCWHESSGRFCPVSRGGRRGMPETGTTNMARFPVTLPETASARRLAEAAARPLPVIGTTARILLLCARESLDEEKAELIRTLCARVEDWGRFLEQAEFRLIVPLVY